MLTVKMDVNGAGIGTVRITRTRAHDRLKGAYWYHYSCIIDRPPLAPGEPPQDGYYNISGSVVHSYRMGAASLLRKVFASITKKQKELRYAKNDNSL